MFLRRDFVQKQTRGFNHHIGTDVGPLQVGWVALLGEANLFAVNDERAVLHRHLAFEASVHAVVLQHVRQVIGFEQVVDTHDFDVGEVLHRSTKHHAADTAESVDTYFDRHC